jgi:CHAD domain-containing protein
MLVESTYSMRTSRELGPNDHGDEELATQLARIYERALNKTMALLQSQPTNTIIAPLQEWMSATQLAEYWQLYNDKSEPTTAGILKWSKRPQDQFPFPHACMGDLLRFNRVEVDVWAKQEAERRRVQNEKRRLKIA